MNRTIFFMASALIILLGGVVFLVTNTKIEKRVYAVERVRQQRYDTAGNKLGGVVHFTRTRYTLRIRHDHR